DNVSIEYMNADGVIAVDFNESVNPNGLITMYRPSDKSLDYQVNIQSSKTNIPVQKLKKGLWRVKVDWKENDKAYYAEKDIFL
ncbi:MAG: FixH family protein, partial [Saprospiraceae bacterium]|nr:FixH family protein [Saprospiraceae bacterium]